MAKRITPIDSGECDRRVIVQQLAESAGTSSFPKETWTTLATIWLKKDDIRGEERFKADQMSAKYDTRWEMHGYRSDLDPELVDVPKKRRIVYQGRTYHIVAASQIGRRAGIEFLTLAASKVA